MTLRKEDHATLETIRERLDRGLQEFEADAFLTGVVPKLIDMIERQDQTIRGLAEENAKLIEDTLPEPEDREDWVPEEQEEEGKRLMQGFQIVDPGA